MRRCSCCTLILWNWTIHRSYIRDYKRDSFILSTQNRSRDRYVSNESLSTVNVINSINSDKLESFTKTDIDSLFYHMFYKLYFKHVYDYIQLIIYILTHSLTVQHFKVINPVPNIVKAGGMIVYKNKILIIQSNFKKWGFPKGHRNKGESVLECAIREIREETSLVVNLTESDRLLGVYENTVMYYKKLNYKPRINIKQIIQEQKDCTGISWIRLSCLKKQINNSSKNTIPFTSLSRKLVAHYF